MHLSLLPSSIHCPLTHPSIHLLNPPSTHSSNHSSTHPATLHSSIYLSIILLPYPQSTYPSSTDFSIHLNFHPFPIHPLIYPSSFHHPLPIPTQPSTHLSIYSIIHPSNHPFIYLSAQSDIIHPSIIHHSSIHHPSMIHTDIHSPIHPFFSLLSNWVPDTVQRSLIIVLYARISQCVFCATHFQCFHLCFPPQSPNPNHAIEAPQDWVGGGHL